VEKFPCDTVSPVTREQLRRDSRALSRRLAERGPWTGICAIARERDIRLMDTVRISRYDGQWRDRTSAPKRPAAPEGCGGADWLPVDGLGDTERTARLVRELPPGARFATVHAKPAGPWWTPSSPRWARTPGACSPGTRPRSSFPPSPRREASAAPPGACCQGSREAPDRVAPSAAA